MPLIRPFPGLRPAPEHVAGVIAPPYDVLNSAEARARAAGKPHSFLHISKPEIDLPTGIDPYDAKVYERGRQNFRAMLAAGVIKRDPAPYYKEASIFVLPSLSEGNPRVVMEAMAHGLPVITTTNAQSVVEDGKSGFVVPIRDIAALKEKIAYLYNHRDTAEKMGQEARKVMENKKPFGEAVFEISQEILRREGKRH